MNISMYSVIITYFEIRHILDILIRCIHIYEFYLVYSHYYVLKTKRKVIGRSRMVVISIYELKG